MASQNQLESLDHAILYINPDRDITDSNLLGNEFLEKQYFLTKKILKNF